MSHFDHLKFAAKSDVGRKRKNNEDSFGVFPALGFWCVADGMGGGDDGEVASAAAIRAVDEFAQAHPLPESGTYPIDALTQGVKKAVEGASGWIYERTKRKRLKGCGSTFVGVLFDAAHPADPVALHAGDSRLYRLRGRDIKQITKDHSAAELIGVKNENDINPMFRGMILRAVGIQPHVEIDSTPCPVKKGDRILICSDGLSRMVPDKKILQISRAHAKLDVAVTALIAAANEAGGVDNITVELIEVGDLPAPKAAFPLLVEPVESAPAAKSEGEARTGETGDTDDEATLATFSAPTDESDNAPEDTTQATMTIPEASTEDEKETISASSDGEPLVPEALDDPFAEVSPERSTGPTADDGRPKSAVQRLSMKFVVVGAAVLVLVVGVLAVFVLFAMQEPVRPDAPSVSDVTASDEAVRKVSEDAARVQVENARRAAEEAAAKKKAEEEAVARRIAEEAACKVAEEAAKKAAAEAAAQKARLEVERKAAEEAEQKAAAARKKAEAVRKAEEIMKAEEVRKAAEAAAAEKKAAEKARVEEAARKTAAVEKARREAEAAEQAAKRAAAEKKAREEARKREDVERALREKKAAEKVKSAAASFAALKMAASEKTLGDLSAKLKDVLSDKAALLARCSQHAATFRTSKTDMSALTAREFCEDVVAIARAAVVYADLDEENLREKMMRKDGESWRKKGAARKLLAPLAVTAADALLEGRDAEAAVACAKAIAVLLDGF